MDGDSIDENDVATETQSNEAASCKSKMHVRFRTDSELSDVISNDAASVLTKAALSSVFSQKAVQQEDDRSLYEKYHVKVMVAILFVLMIGGLISIFHYYHEEVIKMTLPTVTFDRQTRQLCLSDPKTGDLQLIGSLGAHLEEVEAYDCTRERDSTLQSLCLRWTSNIELILESELFDDDENVQCTNIYWSAPGNTAQLTDCYNFDIGKWYGGGSPLAVSTKSFTTNQGVQSVFEPLWFSSKGASIYSRDFVTVEDIDPMDFCISGVKEAVTNEVGVSLNYTICSGNNRSDAHQKALGNIVDAMDSINIRYGVLVYSTHNLAFWNETILSHLLTELHTPSVLILDRRWQKQEGDFSFNDKLFTNVSDFIISAKQNSVDIMLEISPYFSILSQHFSTLSSSHLLAEDAHTLTPHLVERFTMDNDPILVGVLVMSNESKAWIQSQFEELTAQYDLHDFSFLGGWSKSLPHDYKQTLIHPNYYTKQYSQFASEVIAENDLLILQAADDIQHASPVVMLDVDYCQENTSVSSFLETLIHMNLVGYVRVIPNLYCAKHNATLFQDQHMLFINLAASLPIFKLSLNTVDSNATVPTNLLEFHAMITSVCNGFLATCKDSLCPLSLVEPVWRDAYIVFDEFLLGDALLIAPFTDLSGTRDVFIPKGIWTDSKQEQHVGPKDLINVASDDFVPLSFRKVD